MKWLCNLVGHDWDEMELHFLAHLICRRCGTESDNHANAPYLYWRIKGWLLHKWMRLMDWWRCPMCGWHCGQHNPADDHAPF